MIQKAAELGALKAEEQSSKSKLEQKLAARRQKKTEELRKKEARQLKEKAASDEKRLQVRKTNEIICASKFLQYHFDYCQGKIDVPKEKRGTWLVRDVQFFAAS